VEEKEEIKLEFNEEDDQANSHEVSPSQKLLQPKPVEWKTKRTVSTKYNLGGAFTV
jgi:hypothetical protein